MRLHGPVAALYHEAGSIPHWPTCCTRCQLACTHALQTQLLKPTEFEALAGKGAAKKWKATLRVSGGASADMTVQSYLTRMHKVRLRAGV